LKKNVVLTGMMGVGKSTVGKNLAERLNYKFVDIDRLIEKIEGCSIKIIFKQKSEIYFRKLEKQVTLRELEKENIVLALGGGAFLDKSVRQEIQKKSISFWLDTNLDILIKRLKKTNKRPLLYQKNLSQTVKKIYLDRKKTYSKANFKIKCDNIKTEKIVYEIIRHYENS
tara:strand:- start:1716 stop:2225 length:510 start_codon:yes stop_codon:yes gene_type:complete